MSSLLGKLLPMRRLPSVLLPGLRLLHVLLLLLLLLQLQLLLVLFPRHLLQLRVLHELCQLLLLLPGRRTLLRPLLLASSQPIDAWKAAS